MTKVLGALAIAGVFVVAACSQAENTPSTGASAAKPQAIDPDVTKNLATFDDLDFNVFTHQKWDELSRSHSKDIVVHWPDGHQTVGLDQHIADLKAMFAYAPDTRILVHPIKFGSGEWTSVIGEMEGTFSAPMPVPGGQAIPPTGKAFKLSMNTIGKWNKNGTMDEEYLFWDNATYMKQIGLAK